MLLTKHPTAGKARKFVGTKAKIPIAPPIRVPGNRPVKISAPIPAARKGSVKISAPISATGKGSVKISAPISAAGKGPVKISAPISATQKPRKPRRRLDFASPNPSDSANCIYRDARESADATSHPSRRNRVDGRRYVEAKKGRCGSLISVRAIKIAFPRKSCCGEVQGVIGADENGRRLREALLDNGSKHEFQSRRLGNEFDSAQ